MNGLGKVSGESRDHFIDSFISSQVTGRGLDERTAKAYRLDLEKFYLWLESGGRDGCGEAGKNSGGSVLDEMELYLNYLSREKGLRCSTICRKQRVFGIYLSYLASVGIVKQLEPLKPLTHRKEDSVDTLLTKKETDAFFRAIDNEYADLDSDFRRRICLRDQVMMKLLFYHEIEVSELLRLEQSDYDRREAVLTIRGKRGKTRSVKLFSKTLREQMDQWMWEHAYFEHDERYENRMFLSKLGKPLSMKMVIIIFDKYRQMAGIDKNCKPKDLKNSLERYAREMVMELG